MSSYNELLALIDAYINQNGVQAITGQVLNGVLRAMVDQLGRGYAIMGAALPNTDPGTPDAPESWFASTPGTYTNFDGLTVANAELALLSYSPTDQAWTKQTLTQGIVSTSASVDNNVGTPSVTSSYVNGVLTFTFQNLKGNPGQDGDAAGFGTVSATVDGNVGTPGVSVQTSGPNTAKNMVFQFTNLKGETGVTSVVATVDNTSGSPQCAVSLSGGVLTLAFTGLKGAQGDTGSSVAYPFTIVNNLTTNDATQALSAAMGVQLESEVTQLEQELHDEVGGEYVPELDIEQGKISSGVDAADNARIRTHNFITGDKISVTTSGNKVYVVGYNSNGAYVGEVGWVTTSQTVSIVGANKYRLIFAYSNDAVIVPEDFSSLGISITTIFDGKLATKGELENTNFKIDGIEELTSYPGNIGDAIIESSPYAKYKVVPVVGGESFEITMTTLARIAIVKSINTSASLPFSLDFATGETARRQVVGGGTISVTLPADSKFVLVQVVNVSNVALDCTSLKMGGKPMDLSTRIDIVGGQVQGALNSANEAVNISKPVKDLGWAIKLDGINSAILPPSPIVLAQDGDELEFEVSDIVPSVMDSGGYAFTKGNTDLEVRGLFISKTKMGIRSDDGTWVSLNGIELPSASTVKIKVSYSSGNIYVYGNDTLLFTYTGQKTITIIGFGNGVTSDRPTYWGGVINWVKYNQQSLSIYADFEFVGGAVLYRKNGFLSDTQAAQLALNSADLYVSKTATSMKLYKKRTGNSFIMYPLDYRQKTYTPGQYPSYYDNWGIGRPVLCSFNGTSMDEISILFDGAEAELAVSVPDANDTYTYVGGAMHGFENITDDGNGNRNIRFIVDGVGVAENSVIDLTPIQSVDILQESELCVAYTNTNPFCTVLKHWVFDKNGLAITTKVTLSRATSFQRSMFGMLGVYRHYDGNSSNDYLTNRAIKSDHPFTIYDVSDGWESQPGMSVLNNPDKDCTEIKLYGECELGFALEIRDANTKPNGGMFISTNGGQAYNKTYFDLTGTYSATIGEELHATQEWLIE